MSFSKYLDFFHNDNLETVQNWFNENIHLFIQADADEISYKKVYLRENHAKSIIGKPSGERCFWIPTLAILTLKSQNCSKYVSEYPLYCFNFILYHNEKKRMYHNVFSLPFNFLLSFISKNLIRR